MAVYRDNFESMRNAVKMIKQNCPYEYIGQLINRTMRDVLNSKHYWADLLKRHILYCPAEYTTGTASLTQGSTEAVGSGVTWPVNDLVNTTVSEAVTRPGIYSIRPASVANIHSGTVLYVDAGGTPEVCAVIAVDGPSVELRFEYPHTAGFTLTASSYAGRQFRLSDSDPTFTINAVKDSTTLILESAWLMTSRADETYSIRKTHYSISPLVRDVLIAIDRSNGLSVEIKREQGFLDVVDPQRSSTGSDPVYLAVAPRDSVTNNLMYEIWPAPTEEMQLDLLIVETWPDMRAKSDRPPPFIDPSVIIDGTAAKALLHKVIETGSRVDPFYDPTAARMYMEQYERGVYAAVEQDELKALQTIQSFHGPGMAPGDTEYWQSHDLDVLQGRF